MRSVGVSSSVPATNGSTELNHHNRKELKQVRDGGAFDGQRLTKEDKSRINEGVVNGASTGQRQHPHPQGPLVQWERFLPLRSLKVLLVEDDDCTRHVVSALLRNCSYEVTAVANGLEAWKVLIDLNKQIDLVLTEVVMPYLSGIGLLTKIMNHIPRKHIPVIMMSSDDSMGIVFNCLSKGAVDFLVKPIRKNELKNLWQHVWRKCHSSSGSESESGIRARKKTHARSNEASDDDSDEDDDISIGLTAKDGSDNGSGTQSSWSKKAVKVESEKYSRDQLAGPPDSTCAQVIRTRPDTVSDDAAAMGKDLEIGVLKDSEKNMEIKMKETGNNVMIAKANSKGSPALEISLKRARDLNDPETSNHKRNVLRQSDISAFSRYNNTTSNENQTQTGNVGSCSPLTSSKPLNIEKSNNSNGALNPPSNNDMGSSTNNAFSKPDPLLTDKTVTPTEGGEESRFQVCHHHHYHHHHHRVHKQQMTNEDGEANYGSASGSNNGSQKGNSSYGGDNEKGKIGNVSGSGVDQDRLALREAALIKFRQKRKDRCFEKKVRYQSRKKLAEQRPRVRGQFVRQGKDADS